MKFVANPDSRGEKFLADAIKERQKHEEIDSALQALWYVGAIDMETFNEVTKMLSKRIHRTVKRIEKQLKELKV